jgi:hypothetical protein
MPAVVCLSCTRPAARTGVRYASASYRKERLPLGLPGPACFWLAREADEERGLWLCRERYVGLCTPHVEPGQGARTVVKLRRTTVVFGWMAAVACGARTSLTDGQDIEAGDALPHPIADAGIVADRNAEAADGPIGNEAGVGTSCGATLLASGFTSPVDIALDPTSVYVADCYGLRQKERTSTRRKRD